jgi:tripartite-type tricarboxylate transporter receptor subunit TctC
VTIAPLVQRTPYNPETDLIPVAMTTNSPYILVVKPSFPARDIAGFIAEVKSKPGRYTFGTSGTGATAHLVAEFFNRRAGLDVVHVPFAGSTPALTNVMGGSVDYCIETFAATAPLFRQGQLRALGCSLEKGTYLDPSIPPFATAANMPGFNLGAWGGLMVPARTPAPVVQRLAEAMATFKEAPDVRQNFDRLGAEVEFRDAAGFVALLRQQKEVFTEVVRTANIKLD